MFTGTRDKAVFVVICTLVALAIACGSIPKNTPLLTPDIDDVVETEVLPKPIITHVPTVSSIPTATSKPVPLTITPASDEIEENVTCTLTGGEVVRKGWSGKDTGANYCNQCRCLNAGMACTRMACPSVNLPATSITRPTQVPSAVTATPVPVPPTSNLSVAQTPTKTPESETRFKPSIDPVVKNISVERAVSYGYGETVDGPSVNLLLDLYIPDTGGLGPRPLAVFIHPGSFTGGSRIVPGLATQVAQRGWIVASIDYRLQDDNPLPGPRMQKMLEVLGGQSSPALYRSMVAAVEDTLMAIEYLLGRAEELEIASNQIVLMGASAGAITSLNVAYAADKFGIDRPDIAAVVALWGAIPEIFGEESTMDPGEASLFIIHGTEDRVIQFTHALNLVKGAELSGISYEFHPQEGAGHGFEQISLWTDTTIDGKPLGSAVFEFLDRVLWPHTTTVINASTETTQQNVESDSEKKEQDVLFWNRRPIDLPECTTGFKFSHQLANPEDVEQLIFGPGSHIAPHDHMAYWGLWRMEDRIQLFAPTDIFRIDVREGTSLTVGGDTKIEWGGYLYTCDGHQIMLGHVGYPSDEIKAILEEMEPQCTGGTSEGGGKECIWVVDTFIPAGTPIFKNSGYTGAFDFGLNLFGLTAKELQEQPGYGYSITPWRAGAPRAVCPLEYFPEPTRSDYLNLLGDFSCGPFNQDVPGTVMGYWLPSPSPQTSPLMAHWKGDDEWEIIWLFQSYSDRFEHGITVGSNTFGLDYNEAQYYFSTVSGGLVNQRWDSIRSGQHYCTELKQGINMYERNTDVHKIIITALSEDGTQLTIEAIDNDHCGDGPWEFEGGERTFYR